MSACILIETIFFTYSCCTLVGDGTASCSSPTSLGDSLDRSRFWGRVSPVLLDERRRPAAEKNVTNNATIPYCDIVRVMMPK